jgi:acyl carrier protein
MHSPSGDKTQRSRSGPGAVHKKSTGAAESNGRMVMSSKLTEAQIHDKFAEIVAESLRIDRERVTMDAHLMEDLGGDSLDLIEITMETETAFNVWLPEKSILETAAEVFGPDVLVRDGMLTAAGKEMLRRRVPPESAHLFDGEVTVKTLQSYFLTVHSWVALINRLMEYTPVSCEACGGPLKAEAGFRMQCTQCHKQVSLRSGEELNRDWVQQYYDQEYRPSQVSAEGEPMSTASA